MSRRLPLVALAALALTVGVAASATARGSNFSAVQASGSEFRIVLSRARIKPGRLRLEFLNRGEDIHDLAIRRVGTRSTHNLAAIRSGERTVERLRVRRGVYMLWCTISDHRARGMRATLRVRG